MKAAALAAALCVAVGLSACGDLGGRYRGSQIVAPPPVDGRALARYPPGSPQRTVLEWFGTLQRGDAVGLSRYYTAGTPATTPMALRFQLVQARSFFRRVALGPLSVDTVRPDSATVISDLRVRWQAPNGRAQELRSPQSFTLVRERGRWRFADTYFLLFARRFEPKKPLAAW